MKKPLMIGALALAALTAAPAAAEAQSWRGDRDRDGRYERWERRDDRRDHRQARRDDRRDDRRWERDRRRDDRRDYRDYRQDQRAYHRWQRGATIPYNYRQNWYVQDYRRYGYGPPPRGYGYYRTDTGDIVIAALATGVILSLLQ